MLEQLERKRAELMREVHAVTAAIKAYAETLTNGHANVAKKVETTKVSKKHTMSAATAKVAKGRTMSAATKKKLSLAAKARWAKVNAKKAS
jgi:vacuolar-type H+-ATPase subunit D/Vma8